MDRDKANDLLKALDNEIKQLDRCGYAFPTLYEAVKALIKLQADKPRPGE